RSVLKAALFKLAVLLWSTLAVLDILLGVGVWTEYIRFLFLTFFASLTLLSASTLTVAAFAVVVRFLLAFVVVVLLNRIGRADDNAAVWFLTNRRRGCTLDGRNGRMDDSSF